jgi:hypothetical protein
MAVQMKERHVGPFSWHDKGGPVVGRKLRTIPDWTGPVIYPNASGGEPRKRLLHSSTFALVNEWGLLDEMWEGQTEMDRQQELVTESWKCWAQDGSPNIHRQGSMLQCID